MKTALNRGCQGRAASDGGMFTDLVDEALLASLEGRALMARIDAAVGEFCSIDREKHVKQIALTVLDKRLSAPPRPPSGLEKGERDVRNDAA